MLCLTGAPAGALAARNGRHPIRKLVLFCQLNRPLAGSLAASSWRCRRTLGIRSSSGAVTRRDRSANETVPLVNVQFYPFPSEQDFRFYAAIIERSCGRLFIL